MAKKLDPSISPSIESINVPVTLMVKDARGRETALPLNVRGYWDSNADKARAVVVDKDGSRKTVISLGGRKLMSYLETIGIVALYSARKISRERWTILLDKMDETG